LDFDQHCSGWTMLSKGKRPHEPSDLRPSKKVKNDCRDLYANGILTGDRAQGWLNNVASLKPVDLRAMQRDKRVLGTNCARNLQRGYLKHCGWSKLYWASVRVKDRKQNQEVLLYYIQDIV
jgi:hypothetical protein